MVASGSIADTALLPNTTGEESPNPAYFTGPIWPNYKNHNGTTGAMDNVCYEVVTGEPPVAIHAYHEHGRIRRHHSESLGWHI